MTARKFIMKNFYYEFLEQYQQVAWRGLFYGAVRPRALFTLWLSSHGRLATKARLVKLEMLSNNMCAFCDGVDNLQHLFF